MEINRTLLQNSCVITVDKALGNFRRAGVLIEGTKIAAVGLDLRVLQEGAMLRTVNRLSSMN